MAPARALTLAKALFFDHTRCIPNNATTASVQTLLRVQGPFATALRLGHSSPALEVPRFTTTQIRLSGASVSFAGRLSAVSLCPGPPRCEIRASGTHDRRNGACASITARSGAVFDVRQRSDSLSPMRCLRKLRSSHGRRSSPPRTSIGQRRRHSACPRFDARAGSLRGPPAPKIASTAAPASHDSAGAALHRPVRPAPMTPRHPHGHRSSGGCHSTHPPLED